MSHNNDVIDDALNTRVLRREGSRAPGGHTCHMPSSHFHAWFTRLAFSWAIAGRLFPVEMFSKEYTFHGYVVTHCVYLIQIGGPHKPPF